ncbi:MAG TPA: DUF4846 domain-containing protein [Hyphomicrobiaceae bacterium]|nr:DUF4846 domain-containing protein [Hyphomicrobiaceae bacterium]
MRAALILAVLTLVTVLEPASADTSYAWPAAQAAAGREALASRIAPPAGFERRPAAPGSFAAWLRGLPLKPAGAPVLLFSGMPKFRQDVHVAVVDIDVGTRDLQQCADAAMRLRAEWLFASGRAKEIGFNDTGSAKPIAFSRWSAGERPHMSGRALSWSRSAAPDAGYASFRRYMDTVFTWAGTYSLERELRPVPVAEIEAGDLFIKGGFPGHAVMVADIAENRATGEKRFLLLQSFMPAQEIHVLKNGQAPDGSPWYPLDFGASLITPEWLFARETLRRWR